MMHKAQIKYCFKAKLHSK